MIYAVVKNAEIKEHLDLVFEDNPLLYLEDEADVFNQEYFSNDVLLLSIDAVYVDYADYFNYIKKIVGIVNIIALANVPKVEQGAYFLKLGFKSYLNSFTNKIIFNQVLQSIKNGNIWAYPDLMNYFITNIPINGDSLNNSDILESLSSKEKIVATQIAQGAHNKDIAKSMDIAEVTVKKHIGSIFKKLDVKDRVSLALLLR